ncbi:MAG: pteridine reductase [Pseudomonadota bacterium]
MNEHKVALITGAAKRIGAAISRRLHQSGYQIVLHYRHSAAQAQALADELNAQRANSATLQAADFAQPSATEDLIQAVLAAQGRLDVLINNASTYYPTPVGQATQTDWQDLFTSNAQAPFFLAQAAAPALRRAQGCIVNLVDIYAERPLPDHPVYCMAKAANAAMVKSLALDLAPEVRVNGVAPGAAEWPDDSQPTVEHQKKVLARVPLQRLSGADEIAAAVQFLVTGTNYVTGQILAVDGGRSAQQ